MDGCFYSDLVCVCVRACACMFALMCCELVSLQLALIKVKSAAAVAVMSSVFTPHSQAANHQLVGQALTTNTQTPFYVQ